MIKFRFGQISIFDQISIFTKFRFLPNFDFYQISIFTKFRFLIKFRFLPNFDFYQISFFDQISICVENFDLFSTLISESIDIFVAGDGGVVHYLIYDIVKSRLNEIKSICCSTCGITSMLLTRAGALAALAIDQRILFFDLSDQKLEFKKGVLTLVADGSDFVEIENQLVIVGHGIEHIDLEI